MSKRTSKVVLTKGLPASGKSTWAKEQVRKGRGTVKRVNKDDLRAMLDLSEWTPENERLIIQIRNQIIIDCVVKGYDIIVDDTNLHPKNEREIRELLDGYNCTIEVVFFNTDLKTCLERNEGREGTAYVPPKFIREMADKWEKWQHEDCTTWTPRFPLVEQDPDLPDCYLFDIDGTLALNNGHRSFYDLSKVLDDEVQEAVADLTYSLRHHKDRSNSPSIIIFSGREDICREDTELWLKTHDIEFDELFMRKAKDNRSDDIVKSEMFDQYILGKYHVLGIFDDRPKVCRMWRQRGLPLFQVGPAREF